MNGVGTTGATGRSTAGGINGANTTGATGRSTAGALGRGNINQNGQNSSADGNPNRPFGDNGISQNPFFNDPGARQQLNMNDNQYNTLNRAYQQAYGRYNEGLSGLRNNSNLNAQQRQQQIQQLRNQFNSEFGQSLNSTFSDPQMRARYDQLNRQFSGAEAFNDPTLQRQLNLSNDQRNQLRQLSNQWRNQLQQLGRGNGTDTNVNNISSEQWSQLSSQYQDQINSILNAATTAAMVAIGRTAL